MKGGTCRPVIPDKLVPNVPDPDRFVVVVPVVICVGGSMCGLLVRIPSVLIVSGFRSVAALEYLPQMRELVIGCDD